MPAAAPRFRSCEAPLVKYWADDTPNQECAETCLDPSARTQLAWLWVLTGGKGVQSNSSTPCADHAFATYNRTDTIGAGPLTIVLDKYSRSGAALESWSPHACFTTAVPCPGSSDPHCTRTVLVESGDAPGTRTVLANMTDEYAGALDRLKKILPALSAPDGFILQQLPSANVRTLLYCECPEGSYVCEREQFDRVAKTGKCESESVVV
jgi:hypothetical protein